MLPRDKERTLDVVIIQPDFEPGERDPRMEPEMWARSDRAMQAAGLPRKEVATLLLWPESSVLGRDDSGPDPRLAFEARRREIAWLFGTEGGLPDPTRGGKPRYLLLNLVRGEAAGQTPFLQAKVEPMPFGERMPGPAWLRTWLDGQLGFISQEPGQLTSNSSFSFPTPQGMLRVHPVLCSEALDSDLVRRGLEVAGGDLLTSHTNDGWFEQSIATDLHGAQIRLRAVELGLPLVRATLTGKSGIFREDGTWALWGTPRSQAEYAFTLRWRPIRTPARSPWLVPVLELLLAASLAGSLLRKAHS
jgi:apolipoprotein N-acyltransferase